MRLALDLSLPAETRFIGATRRALALYLTEFGTPADIVDDVVLCLDEAWSNVLQHAFPNGGGGHYLLRAELRPEEIMIEVVDPGMGFNPMEHRTVELLDSSGRGFDVMRMLMTTVEIESPMPAGGTRLRMCRQLPPVGG
ncbi:MAG: ATP-binding protein [Actinomycetota bacterium]|nr:ATP-binding protein [Actinomycetota bacterium]